MPTKKQLQHAKERLRTRILYSLFENSWKLIAQKIAKKIVLLRSRSLNFTIAIIPQSFDQMAIADRDLDREKMIAIAIDDQKIADQSCLVHNWWLKPSCSHSTSPFSDWQWPNFKDKIHSNPLQYFSHHVKEWFSQNLPYPDFKISWISTRSKQIKIRILEQNPEFEIKEDLDFNEISEICCKLWFLSAE